MGVLNWITQGCDTLTSTAAPSVDALGLHICIALATIMLVWFGVQEALASAQGGPGFNMAKFLSFFMLITFAYAWSSSTTAAFPDRLLAARLHQRRRAVSRRIIGNDSVTTIQNTIARRRPTAVPAL